MLHRRPGVVGGGLAIAVVMVLTAAVWPTGGATAQDAVSRTLTISKALCPAGYAGDASADECDDTPVAGVSFRVGRPLTDFFTTARTDDEGLVVFDIEGLPLEGTIRIIEELASGTARFVAYCVDEAGTPLDITYEDVPENDPPIGVADVSIGEAGNVLCDWYNVPVVPATEERAEYPGDSGSRYVSPQFGYSLRWDDVWQVDRALSRPGFDALVLSNGTSDVVLSATTGFAGATGSIATPEQCAQQSLGALMARPGTQPTVLQDDAGTPRQGGDDNLFWMEVGYDAAEGTPMTAYISCRGLGLANGAMQTFIHLAPARDYDTELSAVDALLEAYEAPRLDLERLDPGTRPEPAP